MLEITAIITDDDKYYYTYDHKAVGYKKILINGDIPQKTFVEQWYSINSKPVSVQCVLPIERVNYRYELIDATLVSDKILSICTEDVVTEINDNDDRVWKLEYAHLQSLYERKWDELPLKLEDVEFTLNIIMAVKDVKCAELSYKIQAWQWESDGLRNLTEKDVKYQLLDRLLFHPLLLPQRPCRYTSEESYKIVRQYVKQHINLNVAEITSDYNFCFTVKKLIQLNEPEKYTVNTSMNKKPKYVDRYRKHRDVTVFEMTYSPENYKGYTPIQAFTGSDMEDLKAKIDTYCKGLIEYINESFVDCPTCKGLGVITTEFNKDKI